MRRVCKKQTAWINEDGGIFSRSKRFKTLGLPRLEALKSPDISNESHGLRNMEGKRLEDYSRMFEYFVDMHVFCDLNG